MLVEHRRVHAYVCGSQSSAWHALHADACGELVSACPRLWITGKHMPMLVEHRHVHAHACGAQASACPSLWSTDECMPMLVEHRLVHAHACGAQASACPCFQSQLSVIETSRVVLMGGAQNILLGPLNLELWTEAFSTLSLGWTEQFGHPTFTLTHDWKAGSQWSWVGCQPGDARRQRVTNLIPEKMFQGGDTGFVFHQV